MFDNIPISYQVHDLQVSMTKLRNHKIIILESLKVGDIIVKLLPTWHDYSSKLLHMEN